MKKEWKKPTVEMVALEFDKVMDAPCHGSSNTPSNSICGQADAAKCWSNVHTN